MTSVEGFDPEEVFATLRQEVWQEGDPVRLVLREPQSGRNSGMVAVLCAAGDPLLETNAPRVYGPNQFDRFVEACRLEALAYAQWFLTGDADDNDD